MNGLYQSLNQGSISMLESPTDTRKTMRMIWSGYSIDSDKKKKQLRLMNGKSQGSDDEPYWLRDFVVKKNNDEQFKEEKEIWQTKWSKCNDWLQRYWWGYRYMKCHGTYTTYNILFIIFIIRLTVTAFIIVASTYFQLAAEDHKWWWRSFLCGG